MKKIYTTILKQCFRSYLLKVRNEYKLTQSQMAEKLNISLRSYASLESGEFCCSAVTLIVFILTFSDNGNELLKDLHKAFDEVREEVP